MDGNPGPREVTFLTEAEMVSRYRDRVSAGTLKNWRSQRRGPPFVKVGRQVLYPLSGLEEWERSRTVVGSEAGQV